MNKKTACLFLLLLVLCIPFCGCSAVNQEKDPANSETSVTENVSDVHKVTEPTDAQSKENQTCGTEVTEDTTDAVTEETAAEGENVSSGIDDEPDESDEMKPPETEAVVTEPENQETEIPNQPETEPEEEDWTTGRV